MRACHALLLVGVLAVACVAWSEVAAACDPSVLLFHGADSYFLCRDMPAPAAYAYEQNDPAGVNTGDVKISCEENAGSCGMGGGILGDGQVAISADWSAPGMAGCPILSSVPQRIVLVVGTGGTIFGTGLIVSLRSSDAALGYVVEMAHPFDPVSETISPIPCGQTAVLLASTATGTASLHFSQPPVRSDCDQDSLAVQIGLTCPDEFKPVLSYGPVYTRVQSCTGPPDLRREGWTNTGVVPDANGLATVHLDAGPPGSCHYVGSTTVLNGVETGILTGFVLVDVDCVDADGDGFTTCQGDCDDGNPAIYPGAVEICNGRDDNCDGRVDEGLDADLDGIADCFDNCPTVPNPDQNICACAECNMIEATLSFSSPYGKGSGVVIWRIAIEVDFRGFNIITLDQQGHRTQLNPVLIPCEECTTGVGHVYTYVIPKHKSGHNIFIEALRLNGTVLVFGPVPKI